ncbi:MAG: hypothetical protein LBH00_02455 [Planctomycetaceae bacterium]|nr:hypothetical protein [Planctomycetaceae bacterium]
MYSSFKEFTESCFGFFRKRMKWAMELCSRLTEVFQQMKKPQIQNG